MMYLGFLIKIIGIFCCAIIFRELVTPQASGIPLGFWNGVLRLGVGAAVVLLGAYIENIAARR